MNRRLLLVVTGLVWLAGTASIQAHHSFAAEYDRDRTITVTGTVQKLEWTNDANLTVNNLLKDFRDTYFSTLGTTNLLSAGVVNARNDDHARAIHSVVREVFEETGLLCVRGRLPTEEQLGAARRRVLAEQLGFADFLAEHALAIDADDFPPAGEWLTPPFVPIRFQTQYFLHRVRDDQREELIEGEIVGLDWLTAADARRSWHAGRIKISTPVAYTLRQLAAARVRHIPGAVLVRRRDT